MNNSFLSSSTFVTSAKRLAPNCLAVARTSFHSQCCNPPRPSSAELSAGRNPRTRRGYPGCAAGASMKMVPNDKRNFSSSHETENFRARQRDDEKLGYDHRACLLIAAAISPGGHNSHQRDFEVT